MEYCHICIKAIEDHSVHTVHTYRESNKLGNARWYFCVNTLMQDIHVQTTATNKDSFERPF